MAAILGDPEALAAEVSRRAHHRAVEIAEDARRRAAAILEGAREESESIRRQSAQDRERQVAALERRNAARAELEARRRWIALREAPIQRVWQTSEQWLRAMIGQPEYRAVLKLCALRAARELGTQELTLAADPAGHALLSVDALEQWSREAGVRFIRASEPAATWGGLLATSGRSRFDATFPTQLAAAQQALRERVFEILSKGAA
ncbi:MAG TPA: V-type ATP synthase subunit E family protein [Bryobacteraceae bacterium]|nr:V-type ATP synthase subunit E family protein [Bryobacteraceae bacterium]